MMRVRKTLRAVLSLSPPPQDVREFVHLCHQIATINLQARAARGGLRLDLLGLSVSDLALDCIAPLFTRDESNRFPKLLRYFNDTEWESATDAVLLSRLRALIFSIAQQEMSRIYQAADPSLTRIIENLRYAIGLTPEFAVEERFGHPWVMLRERDGEDRLTMPGEFLEAHLSARLASGGSFQDILRELHIVFSENRAYFPGYPLIDFALRIRTCVVRSQVDAETARDVHAISAREIASAIENIAGMLERELRHTYIDRGTVEPAVFEALFGAMRSILEEEYSDSNAQDERAFYEHLHALLPHLTPDEYRKTYRSRLEYLVKLGRQRLVAALRAELQ